VQPRVALVVCEYTIENRLHYRRDVTFREAHCQVRKGAAPHVLAVLNSFLLALLDFLGVPKCCPADTDLCDATVAYRSPSAWLSADF
jgi:hypothetical protein